MTWLYLTFIVACAAHVQTPKTQAPGTPWAWYGEFMGVAPQVDKALLDAGYHIAYLPIPDMYGSPEAVAKMNLFYEEMVGCGLARKPLMIGVSRGGLYVYNWAEANPGKVAGIVGMSPVLDFKSWPRKIPAEWEKLKAQYHFASDVEAMAYTKNPVDNLAPLARFNVPLLNIYGVDDDVAPWTENTWLVDARYTVGAKSIGQPGMGHKIYAGINPDLVMNFALGAQ